MSYLKKPKYGNLVSTEKKRAWSTAFDMIGFHSPWLNFNEYLNISEPISMSDEEVYYIASVVSELKTLTQQRALIDMMHLKCDSTTVRTFMSYFSKTSLEEIMLSC